MSGCGSRAEAKLLKKKNLQPGEAEGARVSRSHPMLKLWMGNEKMIQEAPARNQVVAIIFKGGCIRMYTPRPAPAPPAGEATHQLSIYVCT